MVQGLVHGEEMNSYQFGLFPLQRTSFVKASCPSLESCSHAWGVDAVHVSPRVCSAGAVVPVTSLSPVATALGPDGRFRAKLCSSSEWAALNGVCVERLSFGSTAGSLRACHLFISGGSSGRLTRASVRLDGGTASGRGRKELEHVQKRVPQQLRVHAKECGERAGFSNPRSLITVSMDIQNNLL